MAEPDHLGPYRVGKVIGRGGMGTVYAAQHVKSGEEVAVKLIAQHVADDQRFRRRFDAEVETLKRLRHVNIVRLIGYGEESGRLFYSMEMVHGHSLQQRIREVKRLGWLPTLEITIQICAALKHAHDIGVIHRDLKPANLLMTDAGEVKLVDFGIAKLFGFGEQTMSGSVLGTADYMAPEQAGTGKISTRTDLYALGSVMYAMLAGRSPFAGKNITKVIESLKRDRPVPLDLVNPDVPDDIVSLIHQLLEKVPEDRPPTALAVGNRLKAIRAGLLHGRTLELKGGATKVGKSTGAEPITTTPGGDTASEPRTDGAHAVAHDQPTNATGANDSAGKTVPKSPPSLASADVADPADNLSIAAETMDSLVHESQIVEPSARTRFQTIDEEALPSRWMTPTPADSSSWVSIAALSAMLLAGAGGIFWWVQSTAAPSADRIYQRLMEAQSDGGLSSETPAMDQFIRNYPNDSRIDEVIAWREEAELDRMLRRYRAEARQEGGLARLSPEIQSFVRAMDARETSGQAAAAQLQSWLDVFAPDGDTKLNSRVQRMKSLARDEMARLETTSTSPTIDPRVEELTQRIAASENMTADERQRLLQGIITLYEPFDWAQAIVQKARQQLQLSNDSSSPNGS